jgi:MFS superfamily sulfate permease-like transporter
VWQSIRSAATPPKLVVLDLSSSPTVDIAGARMLRALQAGLRDEGIALRLVGARATARDILRAERLEEGVGRLDRRISVADVIDEFQAGADARDPR